MNIFHLSLSFLFLAHPLGYQEPAQHKAAEIKKPAAIVSAVPAPTPPVPSTPVPPPLPGSWGNAATWGERAAADGLTVSGVPAIGAIAQRTGGLGHVAIVLEFNDTDVHISEMNSLGFDLIDDRWLPISTFNYIYI